MSPLTPQELAAQCQRLSDEDKITFLECFGRITTFDTPLRICGELPHQEKLRFAQWIQASYGESYLPILMRLALRVKTQAPAASPEEQYQMLNEVFERAMLEANKAFADLATAPFKKGSASKRLIVEQRHELIDQLMRAGQTDWSEIYESLEHDHPHLLVKNKRGERSSQKQVIQKYKESRRPRT